MTFEPPSELLKHTSTDSPFISAQTVWRFFYFIYIRQVETSSVGGEMQKHGLSACSSVR